MTKGDPIYPFVNHPPHRPGTGTVPPKGVFDPLIDALPDRITNANCLDDAVHAAFVIGFQLAHTGYYWEAHEVWEGVWRRTPPQSREFALIQSLIQSANACLKTEMGQLKAAARLWNIAAEHATRAASNSAPHPLTTVMGINPQTLLDLILLAKVTTPEANSTAIWTMKVQHTAC